MAIIYKYQLSNYISIHWGNYHCLISITKSAHRLPLLSKNHFNSISNYVSKAERYVRSRQNGLTTTEQTLINHAKIAIYDALQKTNTFFGKEWKTYQEFMEKVALSPFKEIKVLTIK